MRETSWSLSAIALLSVVLPTGCQREVIRPGSVESVVEMLPVTIREYEFEAHGEQVSMFVIEADDRGVVELRFEDNALDWQGWDLRDQTGYFTMGGRAVPEGEEERDFSFREYLFGEEYTLGHFFFGNMTSPKALWINMFGSTNVGALIRWHVLELTYDNERTITVTEGDETLRIDAKFEGQDYGPRTLIELKTEYSKSGETPITSRLTFIGETKSEVPADRFQFPKNIDERWLDFNSLEEMPDPTKS